MPFQGYSDGLYWLRQEADKFGLDHEAISDVGNRLHLSNVHFGHPVVVHQKPPGITFEYVEDTGPWIVVEKIADEHAAIERLNQALTNPEYNLLSNNCEHFARYVATGVPESKQLQKAVVCTLLGVVVIKVLSQQATAHRNRR